MIWINYAAMFLFHIMQINLTIFTFLSDLLLYTISVPYIKWSYYDSIS